MVDAAVASGVERFVLISTDKAVAPSSVMGASKRVAELIVRQAARTPPARVLAVRFGNVLGSRGSVVPFFKQQIERGGPVTVTHPEMTPLLHDHPGSGPPGAARPAASPRGGELFVLNMGEPVRIVDLAHDLIRLSGVSGRGDPDRVTPGLRPGEKLEEVLWEEGSVVEPAAGTDVFRVTEPDAGLTGAALERAIDELEEAADTGNALQIHRVLSECIPTFVSSMHRGSSARQSV